MVAGGLPEAEPDRPRAARCPEPDARPVRRAPAPGTRSGRPAEGPGPGGDPPGTVAAVERRASTPNPDAQQPPGEPSRDHDADHRQYPALGAVRIQPRDRALRPL